MATQEAYIRDNNNMRFIPVSIHFATGEVTCEDTQSDEQVKLSVDQLYDAIDFCEFPNRWSSDKAIELTTFNCFATLLHWRFDHHLEDLQELCNIAILIDEYNK